MVVFHRLGPSLPTTCVALLLVLFLPCSTASAAASSAATSSSSLASNSTYVGGPMGHHGHASSAEIGYLTLALFIGVVCRKWLVPNLCLGVVPYTVNLLLLGGIIGIASIYTQWDDSHDNYNAYCHATSAELMRHDKPLDVNCKNNSALNTTVSELHAPLCACEDWFDSANLNILHNISPYVILFVFLPPLIFESAFYLEYHIFCRSIYAITAMAVIGVTIATCVTGFFLMYVVSTFRTDINYAPLADFDTAMMCGAMLSATDPVAVVQLLKSLGASRSLGTLIEGESLLNDGTAYAMFLIFKQRSVFNVLSKYQPTETCGADTSNGMCTEHGSAVANISGTSSIGVFLQLALLGPIVGVLIGWLTMRLVEVTYKDVIVETSLTLLSAYTSWCVAEAIQSSGVLAVVATGLYMSQGREVTFTHKAQHFLHEFWEMLGYLFNTFIFLITGAVIGRKWADPVNANSNLDLGPIALIYIWIHVARGVAILILQPFVNKHCSTTLAAYDFDWRHSVVMWWGGLRGAVGLALALIVSEDAYWSEAYYSEIPTDVKDFFSDGLIFNVGFVSGLTLMINGVTMGPLVKYLGLNKQPSAISERNLERILGELDSALERKIVSHPVCGCGGHLWVCAGLK